MRDGKAAASQGLTLPLRYIMRKRLKNLNEVTGKKHPLNPLPGLYLTFCSIERRQVGDAESMVNPVSTDVGRGDSSGFRRRDSDV